MLVELADSGDIHNEESQHELFCISDRGGLGRESHLKRQQEIKKTLLEEKTKKRIKVEQRQREDFRKHMSNKFVDKQIQSDLYKSQKACEQLDKAKVIQRNDTIHVYGNFKVVNKEKEKERERSKH